MVTPARPRIGPVTVTLIPANDLPAAYAALDRLADLARRTGAPSTPLLAQARTHAYRGSTVWTASVDGLPVAVRVARANRRPAKDWGPYLNSQLAYVLPAYRLGGVAKLLWNAALDLAHRTGCRRVKARAGSRGGIGFHLAARHQFWGQLPTGELIVDSPLPWAADGHPDGPPPEAVTARPMTVGEVVEIARGRAGLPLRH
jgi:GNAT superfamily N-acetyltransferase